MSQVHLRKSIVPLSALLVTCVSSQSYAETITATPNWSLTVIPVIANQTVDVNIPVDIEYVATNTSSDPMNSGKSLDIKFLNQIGIPAFAASPPDPIPGSGDPNFIVLPNPTIVFNMPPPKVLHVFQSFHFCEHIETAGPSNRGSFLWSLEVLVRWKAPAKTYTGVPKYDTEPGTAQVRVAHG